jgi:hypothetical protein
VDRKNPVGLMLLSEVALGDMYELKKATVSFCSCIEKEEAMLSNRILLFFFIFLFSAFGFQARS